MFALAGTRNIANLPCVRAYQVRSAHSLTVRPELPDRFFRIQVFADIATEFWVYYPLARYPRKYLVQTVLNGFDVYKLSYIVFSRLLPALVPVFRRIVPDIQSERYGVIRIRAGMRIGYDSAYVGSKRVFRAQKLDIVPLIRHIDSRNSPAVHRYVAVNFRRSFLFFRGIES